jgi:biotin carboxylase
MELCGMKTIIFIGSNKSGTSREALKIANELGFFVVLFTDRSKFIEQREEFPEVHQMTYIQDLLNKTEVLEEITAIIKSGKDLKACISLIDPFVTFTTKISEELGLFSLSSDALYKMENKTRFRMELSDYSYSPFFEIFNHESPIHQFRDKVKEHLPLVIKLPESNGSKDVLLVETTEELQTGLDILQKKHSNSPILVEEYLNGPQFLIEVIVYKNKVSIVAVIEQKVTKKKRFIVTGYLFPALLESSLQEDLEEAVYSIVSQLGLSNGSCHLEMRLIRNEWKLIEINPRISGGAMNLIILNGTGTNLVNEIIKLHLGEEPIIETNRKQYVYTHYITVEKRGVLLKVTGKNRAKKHAGVKEVYVKPRKGKILTPARSMGDRYAYVIATGDTPEDAILNAIEASKEIRFYLGPL